MKLSTTALLASFGSAAAFSQQRSTTALYSAVAETETITTPVPDIAPAPPAEAPKAEIAKLETAFTASDSKNRIQT